MSKEEPYMTFMTNKEIVKHIEHLKTLDLPELEKQSMISDWKKSLNQNKYEEQYIELEKWLNDNNKKAISGLYPKEGYDKEYRPISNFSVKIDKWLLDNCPLTWVTDKIKWQYGI